MYDREFYLGALKRGAKAPRLFHMAREIRIDLEGEDIPFNELVAEAAAMGQVKPKTVKSWLYGAAKFGLVHIDGEYTHRRGEAASDTRLVRLGNWPTPEGFE